jgi:hypothetical protein
MKITVHWVGPPSVEVHDPPAVASGEFDVLEV